MSPKKLSTESITNELAGASLFFAPSPKPDNKVPQGIVPKENESPKKENKHPKPMKSPDDATVPSRYRDSKHDVMPSRHHDTMYEGIRKAVKEFGKEPSTHRLTPVEKKALTDIVYTYHGRGMRTSENEIARIAINFLINDYQENGGNSLLEKILRLLHE